MITPVNLNERTRKDLEQMAKRQGISGWREMRKDQLVRALKRKATKAGTPNAARTKASNGSKTSRPVELKRSTSSKAAMASKKTVASKSSPGEYTRPTAAATSKKPIPSKTNGARKSSESARVKSPLVAQRIKLAHEERERLRDLATDIPGAPRMRDASGRDASRRRTNGKMRRDRIVLMVRDPYWLHACWEVSRASVERVRAAMCEFWHTARPVLRLLEVDMGATTSTAERVVREIEVHGGVNNWYLDVADPPKSFRVDLGYLAANGRFHSVVRSNSVTTPRPGASDALDQNWTDVARNFEKVYALSGGYNEELDSGDLKELFEERLNRSMESPLNNKYGVGADSASGRRANFEFDVDAELIVFGQTRPDAHVSLAGQPVRLREDGSFAVRKSMPDRRQVLPIVAGSRDGLEQRTIILAIERNTKVMEPVTRDTVG